MMKPLASSLAYDGMGSIFATQGTDGPKVMVDAHMDQRWVIIVSKGPVKAVTGIRDIHVVPADERTRVLLDVGARNEAEVREMGISPGDPIVPDAPFEILNGTQNYLGKGWYDRVGCAVIVEAMRPMANEPHPNQIAWVITTQEEICLYKRIRRLIW
jgi:putative aminopeptidase FrvX